MIPIGALGEHVRKRAIDWVILLCVLGVLIGLAILGHEVRVNKDILNHRTERFQAIEKRLSEIEERVNPSNEK